VGADVTLLPNESLCEECDEGRVPASNHPGETITYPCEHCHCGVVTTEYRTDFDTRKIIDEIDLIHRETVARLVRQLFQERHEAMDRETRLSGLLRDAMRLLGVSVPDYPGLADQECEQVGRGH